MLVKAKLMEENDVSGRDITHSRCSCKSKDQWAHCFVFTRYSHSKRWELGLCMLIMCFVTPPPHAWTRRSDDDNVRCKLTPCLLCCVVECEHGYECIVDLRICDPEPL
jgi:hypothetical protein